MVHLLHVTNAISYHGAPGRLSGSPLSGKYAAPNDLNCVDDGLFEQDITTTYPGTFEDVEAVINLSPFRMQSFLLNFSICRLVLVPGLNIPFTARWTPALAFARYKMTRRSLSSPRASV